MSTRGAIGFRIDGEDKISYNHSDSYPDWLGKSFVKQARKLAKVPDLADKVRKLQWTRMTLQHKSNCILSQGDLIQTLKTGIAIDSGPFIADSLFCEYAYIINLDTRKVEFYRGFQEAKHDFGRYGHLKETYPNGSTYWGCKLVGEFPLDNIPRNWAKVFPKE